MSQAPDPSPAHAARTPEPDSPISPSRRRLLQAGAGAAAAGGLAVSQAQAPAQAATKPVPARSLQQQLQRHIQHVVVIYLENRSFNNLFADFPGTLEPLSSLPPERFVQRDRDGQPLPSLPKVWGGMVPRSQSLGSKTYMIDESKISGLPNAPYVLKDAEGQPLPESVITRDLCHLFYQNQMQIHGGKNDEFVAWSDAGGLVMGYYGASRQQLGLWKLAQQYTLCDRFFMAAFGGSYLNHQFLVSGRTPEYFNAANTSARSRIAVTEDGPTGTRLALAPDSPASALDGKPKYVNDGAITPDGYAVNTMAPPFQPSYTSRPQAATRRWPTRTTHAPCRRRRMTRLATCCRAKV